MHRKIINRIVIVISILCISCCCIYTLLPFSYFLQGKFVTIYELRHENGRYIETFEGHCEANVGERCIRTGINFESQNGKGSFFVYKRLDIGWGTDVPPWFVTWYLMPWDWVETNTINSGPP